MEQVCFCSNSECWRYTPRLTQPCTVCRSSSVPAPSCPRRTSSSSSSLSASSPAFSSASACSSTSSTSSSAPRARGGVNEVKHSSPKTILKRPPGLPPAVAPMPDGRLAVPSGPPMDAAAVDALIAALDDDRMADVHQLVLRHGFGLSKAGFNILMYAAANRKGGPVVKELLGKYLIDLNVCSAGKVSNFAWAEEYVLDGRGEEWYAEEIIPFDEGLTAIQLAALSGSVHSFDELIRAGASLGPTRRGRSVQQLISSRYEPGGMDSKRALAKALLDGPAKGVWSNANSEAKGQRDVPLCNFTVKGQRGSIPRIGFGTAVLGAEGLRHIKNALDHGYRHLDAALLYGNQVEVGQAIRESGIPREEIFLTSKVSFFPGTDVCWYNANNVKGQEASSIDLCLKQLGVDYVDLLLVHNACATVPEYKAASVPHFFELFNLFGSNEAVTTKLPGGESIRELVFNERRQSAIQSRAANRTKAAKEARDIRERTWKALELALKQGKCRYIGVANYCSELILEMTEYATVMPCMNQVEFHPRNSSPQLRKTCRDLGIPMTAYGSCNSVLIEKNPVIADMARRLGKTPFQVVLRWTLQCGLCIIPAGTSETHIQENLAVLDFELSEADMAILNNMNQDHCYYWDPRPNADMFTR